MIKTVYPGSFDPVTNGHLDIIERASRTFDAVVVAVVKNPSKDAMFSVGERVRLLRHVTAHLPNVTVDHFEGLLTDYMHQLKASVVIKGLRAISDFEYEFQMALMNRTLDSSIETLFMMTNNRFSYLSSSLVKEVARLGGPIDELVPAVVAEAVEIRLSRAKN
ncbi:MAG: Phosphopantetheine adenylyltransferase [Firmicutes bacterium]|nr:Phosphopantetheine adenylyltransferase [Bacillota bacterium]MBT9153139.1 Phosphopantetheine adenylyltransferase [Bacillota bacterium]MBT9157462.1 Phosphopantetheine adenylyltransferase [Bacillota bacterium]